MGIEPEQVLEQNRIATECRIKNSDTPYTFYGNEQQRNSDNRWAQNLDDSGRVMRPDKQRQSEPRHSRSTHLVDRHYEVQAGKNGGKACDEDPDYRKDHIGVTEQAAVRSVESPTRIDTAG